MLYRALLKPWLFRLDPERAHELAIACLERAQGSARLSGLVERLCGHDPADRSLEQELFGLHFKNPLGLAAGFDKNGRLIQILPRLGFGCLEIGTVTFHPQAGNPRPRLFRLPRQAALINRLGFNNEGAQRVAARLARLGRPPVPLGINLGKSRDVPLDEAPDDYLRSFRLLYQCGDYFVINVSSPNTPGLRRLQSAERLSRLLEALGAENRRLAGSGATPKPLLLKIAPDLAPAELDQLLEVALAQGLAGIIATNTTITREGLCAGESWPYGEGGLSGRPLAARSTAIIREIYRKTEGQLPIIGVGGIMSAADAWEKLRAGASLLQLYTGLIYQGPGLVSRIIRELSVKMQQAGYRQLSQISARVGQEEEQ